MAPHDTNTFMNWADGGNPVPPAAVDTNWPGSNWGTNPTAPSQFQIDGTPSSMPEPATLLWAFIVQPRKLRFTHPVSGRVERLDHELQTVPT